MSKVPFLKRLAIWRAYNKRCVYTSSPIEFHELHIDHIIPERLAKEPDELKTLLSHLDLPLDFDLNSTRNLVPCRSNINLLKGGRTLNDGTIKFFLDKAASKVEKVEVEEATIKRSIEKDDLLLPIGAAIEEGILSQEQAISYLRQWGSCGISLSEPLEFEDLVISGMLQPSQTTQLMDERVRHGNPHDPGLLLENHAGDKIVALNCRDFFDAKSKGYYSATTYGMKMESFFNRTCGVIKALCKATSPKVSFISAPRVGVHDLALLPVSFLPAMSGDEVEKLGLDAHKGTSVKAYVVSGHAKVADVSQHSITLEYAGMEGTLYECFRADIDGDGIEDILVFYYTRAIGGTFGYGDVLIISRLGATELFVKRELS